MEKIMFAFIVAAVLPGCAAVHHADGEDIRVLEVRHKFVGIEVKEDGMFSRERANLDWVNESKSLPKLQAEIRFLLPDRLYIGSTRDIRQFADDKYYVGLKLPSFGRAEELIATTSEAMNHESELAAYYKNVVEQAVAHKQDAERILPHFSLQLHLQNQEENVHIGFGWFIKLESIELFVSWLKNPAASGPFEADMDENGEIQAVLHGDRIHIRQKNFETNKEYFNVSVPYSSLLADALAEESRATGIIKYLTSELGVDVWTTLVIFPDFGTFPNFGTPTWQPFKNRER